MPTDLPKYRRKRPTQLAVVTLTDIETKRRHDVMLGQYGSPESRQRYLRAIADWEAAGRRLPGQPSAPGRMTISGLCNRYRQYADTNYSSHERSNIKCLTAALERYFGAMAARDFGPRALRAWRETLIRGETTPPVRRPWCRGNINRAVHRLRHIFRWAASHELLPASAYEALRTVESLRMGRTTARESEPVKPAPAEAVEAAAQQAPPVVAAMIRLQYLTGMRPGELCDIQPGLIDRSKSVWVYRPGKFKTQHLGKHRVVYLGPRAQEILRPYLLRPADMYCFSPAEAAQEVRDQRHAERVTPDGRGNEIGTNVQKYPRRAPGTHYVVTAYNRAIARACDKADREAREEAKARGEKVEGGVRLVPHWHAHQLRHSFGTNVRRDGGLENAAILLGHSSAVVTDAVYAERDDRAARAVIERVG